MLSIDRNHVLRWFSILMVGSCFLGEGIVVFCGQECCISRALPSIQSNLVDAILEGVPVDEAIFIFTEKILFLISQESIKSKRAQ